MDQKYDWFDAVSVLVGAFLTANALYDVFYAENEFLRQVSALWLILVLLAAIAYLLRNRK